MVSLEISLPRVAVKAARLRPRSSHHLGYRKERRSPTDRKTSRGGAGGASVVSTGRPFAAQHLFGRSLGCDGQSVVASAVVAGLLLAGRCKAYAVLRLVVTEEEGSWEHDERLF
jgi:hypothetical protein